MSEKPVVVDICPVCGKQFKRHSALAPVDLTQHMKTHGYYNPGYGWIPKPKEDKQE